MKQLLIFLLVLSAILFSVITERAWAGEIQCVNVEAEAPIRNNDVFSARAEAVNRAMWAAIEKVAGVEVRGDTVVQNSMSVIDEVVIKRIAGFVKRYELLGEQHREDSVWVRLKGCIDPAKARDAFSLVALDNAVAVSITTKGVRKEGPGPNDDCDDARILSDLIVGGLTGNGFTVVVPAATHERKALPAKQVEDRFPARIVLRGEVGCAVLRKEGEDIGYGIATPFYHVKARLAYRIVAKNSSGRPFVLAAAVKEGKGFGMRPGDALANSLGTLAENVIPMITETLGRYAEGVDRRVHVRIEGITDLETHFAVKAILQNLAWVRQVDEKSLGEFVVSYGENPVYLANSMVQQGVFQLIDFSTTMITVRYTK
jgi:hypothetical protein